MASGTVHPLPKTAIPLPMEQIEAFCRKWGVKEFALFGSVLRDDFRADSDVDVLVELVEDPDRDWAYPLDMKEDLAAIFGRDVDLIERKWLLFSQNEIRKNAILTAAQVVYAD